MSVKRLLKSSLVRKTREYDVIYRKGKRFYGDGFMLVCRPNSENHSRIGISIHRKIRGAAKRNRIKRVVRESFRVWRQRYPVGYDMIFAVRPDFKMNHPEDISRAVDQLVTAPSAPALVGNDA